MLFPPRISAMVRSRKFILLAAVSLSSAVEAQVTTTQALYDAVGNAGAGSTINVGPGEFALTRPLLPKSGVTIKGAGAHTTIITAAASWNPGVAGLPDNETDFTKANSNAYLIFLGSGTRSITITDVTLTAPHLHGAVLGNDCDSLRIYNTQIKGFLWSSIRTWRMSHARIHDNVFVDAGGMYSGRTGGALFMTWVDHSEFWNNRISKSTGFQQNFYGFKGKQRKYCRVHHNDVTVNFSLEFAHENDEYVEIDRNHFTGTISIPKHAGGPVPAGGYSFHIHHNWLQSSYQLEWARNGAEVDHNLFDFDVNKDGGNLISEFGSVAYNGPTRFHDNLIRNPGRGVFWGNAPISNFSFYNNHVIANKTITPRKEGLFGFHTTSGFGTIMIKDNIFDCRGFARPLFRNTQSYGANTGNNTFISISDSSLVKTANTGKTRGPLEPLKFTVGVRDEYHVDGWDVRKAGTTIGEARAPGSRLSPRAVLHLLSPGFPGSNYTLQGRRSYRGSLRVLSGRLSAPHMTVRDGLEPRLVLKKTK